MQKNCLYCGNDLQYQRNTRKYCNDNCKQLAYYKRKGISLSGISEDNSNVSVKESVVVKKENFTINDKKDIESVLKEKEKIIPIEEKIKSEVKQGKTETIITISHPLKVESYEFEESKFVTIIEDYVVSGKHDQEMFQYDQNYWTGDMLSIVQWVTMCLRCLIESLIQLGNHRHIDNHTLFEVADAFNCLADSYCYEFLPANYPYKNMIKELQQKMSALANAENDNEKIRFRLSSERKAKLIATRFIIGDFVPKKKFSELEFPIKKTIR